MRVKGFSLTLRNKAKSRFNPTGELKTLVLRVTSGARGSRRPFKSLGIDLLDSEWDSTTQRLLSSTIARVGEHTFDQYEKRIESIKSKFYENYVALEKGEKSVDQAFADVLDMNARDLIWPTVLEHSSSKNEINYFKDYCAIIGRVPENMAWTYFTPNSFQIYVDHLRNNRKVSESTITSYVKTLRKFFREGQRQGFINQNTSIPKNLTQGYSKAGGRKRFEYHDVLECIHNAKTNTDFLSIAFILLSIHFCGSDRTNWMRLKKNEFYDQDGHEYRGKGLRFVRYKRMKEEKSESIGQTYFSFNQWYIDPLIKLFKHYDKKHTSSNTEYIKDFLIGSFTQEPSVETVKSWYKRRGINECLKSLNPNSKRVVNHQNCRATFEFYGAKAEIPEQTLAFMQGRSIRGSVSHYATMEARLKVISNLHAEAMSNFKMNLLCAYLMHKAEGDYNLPDAFENPSDVLGDLEEL